MTAKSGGSVEKLMCSCGHIHARGEKCTAIVSGTPMLNYCVCTGCTPNGEHLVSGVGMDGGQGIDEIARAEMARDRR